MKAQVKTLTDLVLSRNDNQKPAPPPKKIDTPQFDKKIDTPQFDKKIDTPQFDKKIDTPQFDKKIECFHCKDLGQPRKYCNWIGVGTTTNTVYQLCQQNGHEVLACKVLIAYQPGN